LKLTSNPETLRAREYMQGIRFAKITFGETEIMNGIQQIGFANAVISTDANDAPGKRKSSLRVVFEL
jgi:hypothetical protein